MNYLGLDLSLSSTGFYMICEGGKDIAFEIDTKPQDFGGDIERADYIASYITGQLKDMEVRVAMEDFFTGKQPGSVIKLAILGTMVRARLLERGFRYVTFAPSQIKKFETGKGIAPKDTMLKSVFKKHNFDTSSNNIADACAIAHLCKAYYEWQSGRRDFLQYEQEVLKKAAKERAIVDLYKVEDLNSKIKIRGALK